MSILSYLTNLSSQLVLSTDERINISVSLGFLQSNLKNWSHSSDIQEQAVFGSYDRDTILPRKYDEGSHDCIQEPQSTTTENLMHPLNWSRR